MGSTSRKSLVQALVFMSISIILLSVIPSSFGAGINFILAGSTTPTTIPITWFDDAGTSYTSYSVDIAPASGNSVNGYPANTAEKAFTFTGLRPNTMYTITVTPWEEGVSGDFMMKDIPTEEIPDGEILVSDITSESAFLQWKDYSSGSYTLMTSPTGAVEATGGIFEAEVGITILMPDTMISAMISGGGGGMVLASVNFTSGTLFVGSTDECKMEMPPPRCNSGINPTQHLACLATTTLLLFYTTLLLP